MLSLAVSITTHNRVQDLVRTLDALEKLSPAPNEVIVCADGCVDSTVETVRRDYPQVRLIVHEPGRGSVASRDRILRETSCDLVLSLDDDSYPLDHDFVSRVSRLFSRNPKLGIAFFPQRTDEFPETLGQGDFGKPMWVGSFANSGAVLRRSAYEASEGYPIFFFHAYEEPDIALQFWAAGYKVLYYPDLVIRHHYTTAMRNEIRTHHRHARNECWSIVLRAPAWLVPGLVLYRGIRQAGYAAKRGPKWLVREPQWWLPALRGIPVAANERRGVPFRSYQQWLRLLGKPQPAHDLDLQNDLPRHSEKPA